MTASVWGVVLISSLGLIIAMARAGSTVFWKATQASRAQVTAAHTGWSERAAIGGLALAIGATVVNAAAISRYTEAAAAQLIERRAYIDAVLGAEPTPPLWTPRTGMIKK